MTVSEEQIAWLSLIRDPRWSARQRRILIDIYGKAQALYEQPVDVLKQHAGPMQSTTMPQDRQRLEKDVQWLNQANHHLITVDHPAYPDLLKEISDPPIALFAIGNIALLSQARIAIVGSRRPTPIGVRVAADLSAELSALGIVIVSGMALGIDGLAHQAALDIGGPTIAVLACGVDCVYPRRHQVLYDRIVEQGLLLSEYPLGMRATRFSFPERNRIVSGLCLGVIIVEAAQKSGTLITARLAMEQSREVMVVPGSALSRQYQGSHNLIGDGAALVTDYQAVLHVLRIELAQHLNSQHVNSQESGNQQATHEGSEGINVNTNGLKANPILRHIGGQSTSIDQIITDSGLTAAEVSAMLLTLEVEGLIAAVSDGGYVNLS